MSTPTDRFPGHPMLAASAPALEAMSYPTAVTGKVDGVRGLARHGKMFTRRLKPFPNRHLNAMVSKAVADGFMLDGLDGEFITDTFGEINPGATNFLCNRTTSAVMTITGEPMLHWYLFDIQPTPENGVPADATYLERRRHLEKMHAEGRLPEWASLVPFAIARNALQVQHLEQKWVVENGLEGLVLRHLDRVYKFGRSTQREEGLLRVTTWQTSEAEIIGYAEAVENTNVGVRNEAGFLERSVTVDAKRPLGRLGAWHLRDIVTGVDFWCGTGFDHDQAREYWENRDSYVSQIATYRFKPAGVKDKPRFPSWKGIRSPLDMGDPD